MADEFDLTSLLKQPGIDPRTVEAPPTPTFDSGIRNTGFMKTLDMDAVVARNVSNLKNSLVDKLGVENVPVIGPLLAFDVNTAASVWSGASRLGANLLTTPIDAITDMAQATIPDDVMKAYSREQSRQPLPGDADLLNSEAPAVDGISQTFLNRLQSMDKLRQTSKGIFDGLDISKIVKTTNRDELSDDLRFDTKDGVQTIRDANDAYDKGNYGEAALKGAKGVASVIAKAIPSVASNPVGLSEYVAENTPQLAAGAINPAILAASNVGYGLNEYRDGVTDYQADHQGALPAPEDMRKMALSAAGAAVAENVGEMGILKGFKDVGKGGIAKVLKEVGESSLKEGVTEGVQTKLENNAHLKDTSIEDIVESAAIGAGVGGAFAGAGLGHGEHEHTTTPPNAVETAFTEAVKTGNVDPLSNPESPTYDPVRAVQALHQGVIGDNVAPDKVQAATKQADDIQTNIQDQINQLNEPYTPQAQAQIRDQISQLEAKNDPANSDAIATLQTALHTADQPSEFHKQDMQQVDVLTKQLADVREASDRMQKDVTPDVETQTQTAEKINVPAEQATPETQQATDKILTLTMTNPEGLDQKTVDDLVSNTGNSLNPAQRTALKSFSEAQTASAQLKSIAGVKTDIETGSQGFKGLSQYRQDLRLALQDGDTQKAQATANQLDGFAKTRASKAQAIAAAYEQVKSTDNSIYVAPDTQGNWGPSTATTGGYNVTAKSFTTRNAVQAEATVLEKTAESFHALIAATPAKQTTTSVEPSVGTSENTTEDAGVQTPSTVEEAPADAGKLTALQTPAEVTADTYKSTNLLSAFFTQKATAPLAKVKDFMTAIRTGTAKITDFLPNKKVEELSGKQKDAIRTFSGFYKAALPEIQKVFNKTKADGFQYQDAAGFFRNADGTVDENVYTAIAYGMFSHVTDAAGKLINRAEDINAILHKDAEDEISNKAWAILRRIGTREFNAESSIGSAVYQALGLEALPNAPVNERARIESSLGRIAMNALVQMKMAERPRITAAQFAELSGVKTNVAGDHNFFRLIATEDSIGKLTLNSRAKQIKDATVGTQSIVDSLFAIDKTGTEPSFKPLKFNQSVAKGTQQDISTYQTDALNTVAKQANTLHQSMWDIFKQLTPEARYAIAGVVDMDSTPVHIQNRDSQKAKNSGLMQEVDNADQFFTAMMDDQNLKGIDQPLYFMPSVWRNYRVGLASSLINPQTSKVHRYLLNMPEWAVTLKFNDTAQMDMFKLRVLESFGVKTEGKATQDVLNDVKKGYDAFLQRPAIKAAIEALNNDADEAAILAGVKEGGEGYHSLFGLMALAEMQRAQSNGATEFNTSLAGEVDGVTNGPQISQQIMGTATDEISKQGGFFSIGDLDANGNQLTQFSDYHGMAGNLDTYEGLLSKILTNMSPDQNVGLGAIEGIVGSLRNKTTGDIEKAGRNIPKTPLTALMFGSAPKRAVESMAETFMENVYTAIEKLYNSDNQQNDVEDLVGHINTLIANPRMSLLANISFKDLMITPFTSQQVTAIKASFYGIIGSPTENMFEDEFAKFLNGRNTVNKAAALSFQIYEAVHNTVRDQILEESDNIAKDSQGNPLHDLTQEQLKELDTITAAVKPVVNTAMSLRSNQLNAGMMMAKTKSAQIRSVPYSSEMNFGTDVGGIVDTNGNPLAATKSTKTYGRGRVLQEPGAGPFSMLIHSSDSAAATGVYSKIPSVNVHDAVLTGWSQLAEAGQLFNQSIFNTLMNYSAPTEMRKTLEGVLVGVAPLLNDPKLGPRIIAALKPALTQFGKFQSPEKTLTDIRDVANTADTAKFTRFENLHSVGQYATEGGSYTVTDADRSTATEAKAKVGQDENADALIAAQALAAIGPANTSEARVTAVKSKLSAMSVQTLAPATTLNSLERAKKIATPEQVNSIETVQAEMLKNKTLEEAKSVLNEVQQAEVVDLADKVTKTNKSVWGEIGTPLVASDATLASVLANTSNLTVHGLADILSAHVASTETSVKANYLQNILAQVKRATKQSVAVVYVTSNTGPEGAIGEGVDKSRGWYASRNGVDTIYVKSTDFVESGIDTEMLVHELVHAAVASVIQRELDAKAANSSYTSDAHGLVADLEALRVQAQEMIANNGTLSGKYVNATSNVHELVSWGLTNTGFQRDVLNAIQAENTQKGNPLLNGLQRFIARITGLLFRGSALTGATKTGMGLLINHVSGLFEEAAKLHESKDNITLKYEDEAEKVQGMTTEEVYDALSVNANKVTDAAHDTHLRGLLNNIVKRIFGTKGAFADAAQNQAMTAEDVFLKALDTQKLPFASEALLTEFVLNKQEQYVLEQVQATVEATFNNPTTLFERTALEHLYKEAKAKLTPQSFYSGDWFQAQPHERKLAEAKHAYLFNQTSNVNNRSNYLSRFAALGLASAEVKMALDFQTTNSEKPISNLKWGAKLIEIFQRMLTKLGSLKTKTTPGQVASDKLTTLVDQLTDITAKRKGEELANRFSLIDQAEMGIGKVGNAIKQGVDTLGQSSLFQAATSPIVNALGKGISAVAGNRVEAIMGAVSDIRNNAMKGREGLAAGIWSEIRGAHDGNRIGTELFKGAKYNEQRRKLAIETTSSYVLNSFKEGGKYLTQQGKSALTKVLLRTNISALLDHTNMQGIQEALENPKARQTMIKDLEDQIRGETYGNYYLKATKQLALHKVVGGSVSKNQMLNVENIANHFGTKFGPVAPKDVQNTVKVLGPLMALYGLEYSAKTDVDQAIQIFRTESARGNESGVEMLLKLHKDLQDESKQGLFEGQTALRTDGFVPEKHDSRIELAFINSKDQEYFEKRGYKIGNAVQVDPTIQKDPMLVVTRHGSGQTGLLSGAISFTSLGTKGSKLDREMINMKSTESQTDPLTNQIMARARAQDIADMNRPDPNYDPRKENGQNAVPVLDPHGHIVGYRYMMTEANRDQYLDRDNSMDELMGIFAGQIVDKQSTTEQNADVIRSHRDVYKEEYTQKPSSFLMVGPDSPDPAIRELARLIPYEAREEIKRVWGGDNMYIRADMLDMTLGYRKFSLTQAFDKDERSLLHKKSDPEQRNIPEQLLVHLAGAIWGEKAQLRVGQVEDIWQELVKETKDILVVKNISTLVGNMVSNLTLLGWEGVPIKQAVQSHAIGLKGAMDYRRDSKRSIELERAIHMGYIPDGLKAAQDELVEVRDRMARNPVKPLIDAGLMPTIVEDIEANDDQYSYKSKLAQKVEKYSNRVPQLVKTIGKNIYMTHDTSTYKFLSQTTQLSDFVARYAQYVHLTTRAKDTLSSADALKTAEDSFINYDLPSHRSLQYLNDMGIVWFTKYFLRIQKSIMRLVREKPARALAMVALSHYVKGADTVMNSSWIHHVGANPFSMGAFNYPGTLDELPAVHGLMNLMK